MAARATLAQRVAGIAQIAITGALGGVAFAFVWFLAPAVLADPGYEIEDRHRVTFLSDSTYATRVSNAMNSVHNLEIIRALPGVRSVTLSHLIPSMRDELLTMQIADPTNPSEEVTIGYYDIDSEFADVLGLRLLYGRPPSGNERCTALVNQSFARRFFERDNAVGEILDIGFCEGNSRTEIVGVIEDLSFGHPAASVEPILLKNAPIGGTMIQGVIDSPLPSGELTQQLISLYESGELDFRPNGIRPLGDIRREAIAPDMARGVLTVVTAILAVVMAAFGLFGTQHYLIRAGRREYAIRASLGAGPKALGRLVLKRAFMLGLPGLVIGSLLAFISVAWLRDEFLSRGDIASRRNHCCRIRLNSAPALSNSGARTTGATHIPSTLVA